MIAEAEIRRLAARWRVDPMILDLDYALGWFLAGLSNIKNASNVLCFKGGTCLRKCYYPGYRFSEDLDFTAIQPVSPEYLNDWVEQVVAWSADRSGPDFLATPFRLEVVEGEDGKVSFLVRVYFRGPLRWGGSPRSIRLDITCDELLLWPKEERILLHAYSDADELREFSLSCYSIIEILSEKIRAVCGQRRFAISRDIYDIYRLNQSGVEITDVVPHLADKFRVRGVEIDSVSVSALEIRRQEYKQSWLKQLEYLIPDSDQVTFEDAWQTAIDAVRKVEALLKTAGNRQENIPEI